MAGSRQDPPPRISYRIPEVAAALGISERAVYDLCYSGAIGSTHIGSSRVIPVGALQAYRDALETAAAS